MQQVIYKNSKGEELKFGMQPPYVLQTIKGVGEVDTIISTNKSPFQDGSTYLNSKFESRDIFMQIAIVNREEKELFKSREFIQKVFNPKLGEGTLTYITPNGNYEIKGVADGTPIFSDFSNGVVTCQINLFCADPFWYSKDSNTYAFNAPYEPLFEFPFFSDETTKIEFGLEQEIIRINNTGTIYTPIIIEFDGGLKNATLTNVTTGEYIKINKELLFGETLIIDTSFGSRKIKLQSDGIESNGFKYMSLDSKFLQLLEGENEIKYVAESDGNVTIKLKWTTRYLGL